jgi:hypothetical protein
MLTERKITMSKMYFTADGTYGSASDDDDFIVVDTNGWTDEMLEEVEGCSDSERMWVASHFANGDHPLEVDETDGLAKCKVCFFEPKHLNGGKR